MALNPIAYAEKVVGSFLRYQLSAYPFTDAHLYDQLRRLLSLEQTRNTPLLRGPYLSLSRSFRQGARVQDLVTEGVLHPHFAALLEHPHLYGHQERAVRAVLSKRNTLVSTGTGSGKTECFLYPIIDRCLRLRDENAPPGVVAVIVYPMNALAEDQLGRLRDMLVGTGIPFAMYVGKTPQRRSDVGGQRLAPGSGRSAYRAAIKKNQDEKRDVTVHPAEERCSREELRTAGMQPRILLTNVKQLELLLTRQSDIELFDQARLDMLVFDEAHTFTGALGAETACLIRRLRAYCARPDVQTVCVATSATLGTAGDAQKFAERFFGVPSASVDVVTEDYADDDWSDHRAVPAAPPGDPTKHLNAILRAVDLEPEEVRAPEMVRVFREFGGGAIDPQRWQSSLYAALAANRLVYQLAQSLSRPRALAEVVAEASGRAGRPVTEAEVLAWLALGAASLSESRPLLRPVVHAFVRGISGAVLRFPPGHARPELALAAEDAVLGLVLPAAPSEGDEGPTPMHFPVLTCSTCGQHYLEHYVSDLHWERGRPSGGQSVGESAIWRFQSRTTGGRRVLLVDQLITGADGDGDDRPANTAELFLCRFCGTLHPARTDRCDGCGVLGELVPMLAIADRDPAGGQRRTPEGFLGRCVSCGTLGRPRGGTFREPCRPVRAVTVSDVYVLAQDMVRQAERKRLLVFADNRQDAAFQAGWMRDHARRFRMRALMAERIVQGPVSIGDLAGWLDDALTRDDDLSRALVPEVWKVARREDAGQRHIEERRRFLRILVLREITTGVKQRVGLEPWGRLRVEYLGLTPTAPFVEAAAQRLGIDPARMAGGIAAILDGVRRSMVLYDGEGRIFSRFWQEGDREVMQGYLPLLEGVPRGLKLRRAPSDNDQRVAQWIGERGDTGVRAAVRCWGLANDAVNPFIEQLWEWLVEGVHLLRPATLVGNRGNPLPDCHGTLQLDGDRLRLVANRGLWRCRTCRRGQVQTVPFDRCLAWRCGGTLIFEPENPDSYDLQLLDSGFEMLLPEEHSAQVPNTRREQLERQFKGSSNAVNALVATPTLEMGVDIGGLDVVLLRNVPPLPSNYWQRVGRAGRRHRMAVNVTYARPTSHDRAYYKAPEKLLGGRVMAPRFNLRNEVMVHKHVHATVLMRLRQLARAAGLDEGTREHIRATLDVVLPQQIRTYLFDETGDVRTTPFDVAPLGDLTGRHRADVVAFVRDAFARAWPESDREAVALERIEAAVDAMPARLADVIAALRRRLDWALGQIRRLNSIRETKGSLDREGEALFERCDRLVKRLKGDRRRGRREAEGYDDTNTYAVLAVEGFLPGYGLETGSIVGTTYLPRHRWDRNEHDLPRPPALALREYVPGNMIYANGSRFVPRFFQLAAVERALLFQIDSTNQAVRAMGAQAPGDAAGAALAPLGIQTLSAVPVSDVDLPHVDEISDEEDHRFQLPVAIYGEELGRHGGGVAYRWSERLCLLRRGVFFRLVNVGAMSLVGQQNQGYPLCLVCGQSRSPFASATELETFGESHRERCGRDPENVGFYCEVTADALTLRGCVDRDEAYSLAEALRIGATRVLEMEREDLDVLVLGHAGSTETDAVLYDPMPGGSGLLDQLCERFDEVVRAALEALHNCPARCTTACIDCMLTFRNGFFHRHLNRHRVVDLLSRWGERLVVDHPIPPALPQAAPSGAEAPIGQAEARLRELLARAGFEEPRWQHRIDLGKPHGSTTPDAFFPGDDEDDPGVCVYLDGLSASIHGNPVAQERDRALREQLRNQRYDVVAIPATDLTDRKAMASHFFTLAKKVLSKERAKQIREQAETWFEHPPALAAVSDGAPATPLTAGGADTTPGSAPTPLPSQPATGATVPAVTDLRWKEAMDLLDPALRPLVEALQAAQVDPPDDYDCDIHPQSYARAALLWRVQGRTIGLVSDNVKLPEGIPGEYVVPRPGAKPRELAEELLRLLRRDVKR